MIPIPCDRYTPETLAGGTVVVCLRDPDSSNAFQAWTNGPVGLFVLDIDAGYGDLSDPDEYAEWAETLEAYAADFDAYGHAPAAAYVRDIVAQYDPSQED